MSALRSTARLDETARRRMQTLFKYANRFMILLWRLGLGRVVNLAPRTGVWPLLALGLLSGWQRNHLSCKRV